MKKYSVLLIFTSILLFDCVVSQKNNRIVSVVNDFSPETSPATIYASTITANELKSALYIYASDAFEGRETGKPGQKKAVAYLKNYYKSIDVPSPLGGDDYFQEIPKSYFPKWVESSENVVAFIEGTEKPEEYIVISAHLDHEGIKNGKIYNGADDDGSGTVAILEIAEAFKIAKKNGHAPKRSILFLHATGEEKGLLGSQYFTDVQPLVPLKNIVANLNIDMIGRVDHAHRNDPNYIYLIGSDRLSSELHYISELTNNKYFQLKLDYTYNKIDDPNQFYYRSDHYNFAKHNIPVIFYFNGVHADYHRPTDTPDKIRYTLLEKRTRFIFCTAWELANRENRIIVDKPH